MTNFFMAEPSSAPGPDRACCVLSDGSEAPKDWKYMHPQDAWLGVLQGFYRGPQGAEESCSHLPASSFIAWQFRGGLHPFHKTIYIALRYVTLLALRWMTNGACIIFKIAPEARRKCYDFNRPLFESRYGNGNKRPFNATAGPRKWRTSRCNLG